MPQSSAPVRAESTRAARAAFVRDSLRNERWTIRQASIAIGMSHTALASRVKAETGFYVEDIEAIARLLKADPVEFFRAYLRANEEAPALRLQDGGHGVASLPGLDSNQEPAGNRRYRGGVVVPFKARQLSPEHIREHITVRPVVRLHSVSA